MKPTRWSIVLALVLGVAGSWFARAADAADSFLPADAKFNAQTVQIPMRDGQSLLADLYLPKAGGKLPVVLIKTPYNKNTMRALFVGQGRYRGDALFTDSHYAFVIVDWRSMVTGIAALLPDKPAADIGEDGFDTCAWIAAQPWCDGKIGTWGASALGRVQYQTARLHPPNLVCSVPMIMPLNNDYDVYYPGGAMREEFVMRLMGLGFGDNLYGMMSSHPSQDDFWNRLPSTKNFVRGEDFRKPMLFIGSWYDIYTDAVIKGFEEVRSKGTEQAGAHSKLMMGPWYHSGYDQLESGSLPFVSAQGYSLQKAQAFFDYWMRQVPNDFDSRQPAIEYYQMGANQWRSTDVWPPAGVKDRSYYLQPDRSISTGLPPAGSAPPLTFRYDPANPVPTIGGQVLDAALKPGPQDQREKVESRQDVLVLSTPVLESDLAVAGKLRVKLFVSSDRPDTDFTAIVTDVYPDGRSMLVSEGIQRMRYRNSAAAAELMKAGEVYPITVELTNTAITFLKGHRVRVIVASSNYPMYSLNLNDGGVLYQKATGLVATNSVHADAQHPSALLLPVVPQ